MYVILFFNQCLLLRRHVVSTLAVTNKASIIIYVCIQL